MGGKSEEQTIGYKYFLGLHMVLCQKIDNVLALKFADRVGWRGTASGGQQIRMNRPTLFGGKQREGGVSGRVDVLGGGAAQGKNDYLQSQLGTLIPAFRGVASLVWRQPYLGNNPYLKEIRVKANCISEHGDNWYPEKSHINPAFRTENNAIYIALDVSNSMAGTRLSNQRAAIKGFLDGLKGTRNSVEIVAYAANVVDSMRRINCNDADYDALKAFVDTLTTTVYGTDYDAGVSQAGAFFAAADAATGSVYYNNSFSSLSGTNGQGATIEVPRRVVLFLTDGEPFPTTTADDAVTTLAGIAGVEVYCFNIDLSDTTYTAMLDNTATDGVPVVSGGSSSAILDALAGAFLSHVDMNPAHILRDLLIDTTSGGSGDTSEIGASFTTAADTLYSEGFGLSLTWRDGQTREDFKRQVEEHIDASVYQDRLTGKWEIKLIRDDYDVGTLTTFGDGGIGITEWVDFVQPTPWDLPNQITLTYTRRETGDEGSITLANIAAVQANGHIVNEPVDRRGITLHSLASRVCLRDLRARTLPIRTGAFWALYAPADINIGTPIILADANMGIEPTVVRVTEIEDSDGLDNRVLIQFAEDKFALGDDIPVEEDVIVADSTAALPLNVRLVEEMPYLALVNSQGQTDVDDALTADPDLGLFHATGQQPSGIHLNAQVTISSDAGVTWDDSHLTDFSPVATLQTPLSAAADDVTADIDFADGLPTVTQGSICLIGTEYLRVDNIVANGSLLTVTFGRGCLDTVPVLHQSGEKVIFWQGRAKSNGVQYLATEVLDVRLRPKTGSDMLLLDDAANDQIIFDSRANRPYPVGKLQVEASYAPTGILPAVSSVTWAHRDRTLQTTAIIDDHTAGNIGPEAGVAYTVELRAYPRLADIFAEADFFGRRDFFHADDAGAPVYTEAVATATSWSFDDDALAGNFAPDDALISIGVKVTRAGYDNWQTAQVVATRLAAPTNLTATRY